MAEIPEIDARKLMAQCTLVVRISTTGVKWLERRVWIAKGLMRLAAKVLGTKIRIEVE